MKSIYRLFFCLVFIFLIGLSDATAQFTSTGFITTWKTDNAGTSTDTQVTIPTTGAGYDYNIYWEEVGNSSNNGTLNNQMGDATIEFGTAGTYQVEISGTFPRIYFDNTGDKDKILTVEEWGDIAWVSMESAFYGCSNLTIPASDAPNLSNVTNMHSMFRGAASFDQAIGHWDVGNVTNMGALFYDANSFNQDIGDWDVSNVTDMAGVDDLNAGMFRNASAFNQDISQWNVSSVAKMNLMFSGATAFDQDLGTWDISSVVDMLGMLNNSGLSKENYESTLLGWATLEVGEVQIPSGITLGAENLAQCTSIRDELINIYSWSFNGDTEDCLPFITTWSTANGEFFIPTNPAETYNYDITWTNLTNAGVGDGSTTGETGNYTVSGLENGSIYEVEITGDFPQIYFYDGSGGEKILTVEQWGDIAWTSMDYAFYGCTNLTIPATDAPDLSGVTNLNAMFGYATALNQDIGHWDVSNVTNMSAMFFGAGSFNQDVNGWDVSSVVDMSSMFNEATSFNQSLNSWIVSDVDNMSSMFNGASSFNQDIGSWDVSGVLDMSYMFNEATAFDQNIGNWTVSSVTDMSWMFRLAESFNQDISGWSTIDVTLMTRMFEGAYSFNQDISGWDVSGVTDMVRMLHNTTAFDQNLGAWNISLVGDMDIMLDGSNLSKVNYDKTLIGWATQNVQPGVRLGADGLTYCNGTDARITLETDNFWEITGDTEDCLPFVTTWSTSDGEFFIPTNSAETYNYDIIWTNLTNAGVGDGATTGETGNYTISGLENGSVYQVEISGGFPWIYFNYDGNGQKILTVEQWGDIPWTSMENAFAGCSNLTIQASDAPNLFNVTNMEEMFVGAALINQDLSTWDVSSIKNMVQMFYEATSFNQDLSDWDVSGVTNMAAMFYGATSFNHDLGSWEVSNVTNMVSMLDNCGLSYHNYDLTLSGWATQSLQSSLSLGAAGMVYCSSEAARNTLTESPNLWNITGDIKACFGGGNGTEENPFKVTTNEQLSDMRNYLSYHFILVNNLDLTDDTSDPSGQFWNDGAGWEPIGKYDFPAVDEPFTGTFNGNGFTISGLFINRPETDYIGLFGYLNFRSSPYQDPEIMDLTLSNVNITGFDRTGSLVGWISASNGAITSCSSSGTVTGNSYTGGLIGISSSDVSSSFSTCAVTGLNRVGGLIGDSGGQIHLSYATGSVTGNGFLGGLVGNSTSYIFNSYATGDVMGEWNYIGGLLGYGTSSSGVSYCYATGTTTNNGFYSEGLVGYNDGSLLNGYFDIGACTSSGFASRGVGITTDQMSQESSFLNWNFTDNWAIDEGNSYPYLQWQGVAEAHNIPPEIAAPIPDITNLDDLTGECAVSMPTAPTATDNCSRTIEGVPDVQFPINTPGTTEITWTYDDGNNNISTQTQNVVIADVTAPVADAESLDDVTGQCSVGMPVAPTATDNCDGEVTGTTDLEFPVTAQGTTEITWTFEDAAGNTSTQTQNIVIEDVTDPVPDLTELPDIVGDCDGSVSMPEAPTAMDNCDGEITATTDMVFPITEPGTTEISWTYEDASGNTFLQVQNVIIGQSYETSVEESLCESSSFTFPDGTIWDGETLSQMSVLQSQEGCDSTLTTNITILSAPSVDLGIDEVYACVGEELAFGIDEASTAFSTYTISSLRGNAVDDSLKFVFDETLAVIASTQGAFVTIELTGPDGCTATDQVVLYDNTMKNWGIGIVQNNDPGIVISSSTIPETADSFEWDFGDGTTNDTEMNPTHTYQENGTYTITLTVSNECGDESLTTSVVITGACSITDNTVTTSENSLTANASGFSYQWIDCNNGNAPISGATNQSFTPAESGSYAVEISDGSCTVTSDCMELEIVLGLLDPENKTGIRLYPNPVTEILKVDLGSNKVLSIDILDTTGKRIFRQTTRQKLTVLDVSSYANGIYFISLSNNDFKTVEKFIKN